MTITELAGLGLMLFLLAAPNVDGVVRAVAVLAGLLIVLGAWQL